MAQGRNIETATLEELFSSSTEGSIPVLIDIKHDAIVWSDDAQEDGHLRLINSTTAVKYKGNKYLPCVFTFVPPSEDGSKISGASITISSIDTRVIQMIRRIPSPPIAVIEAFFSKISDTEFMFSKLYHYEFQFNTVTWDNTTAKWNLVFDPTMETNVPKDLATPSRCPAVYEER